MYLSATCLLQHLNDVVRVNATGWQNFYSSSLLFLKPLELTDSHNGRWSAAGCQDALIADFDQLLGSGELIVTLVKGSMAYATLTTDSIGEELHCWYV